MDVGRFRVSRRRLRAWILIPPLAVVLVGLGPYPVQRQADWNLQRTESLHEILPAFVQARRDSTELIELFVGPENAGSLEDQLISFLQDAAQECGFTVDSVNVERMKPALGEKLPILQVEVKGVGSFNTIERYLNEVAMADYFLSEESIRIGRARELAVNQYFAEIVFERLLLSGWQKDGGSK